MKFIPDKKNMQVKKIEESYVLLRHTYYLLETHQRPLALVIARLLINEFPKVIPEERLSELANIKINLDKPKPAVKILQLPERARSIENKVDVPALLKLYGQ